MAKKRQRTISRKQRADAAAAHKRAAAEQPQPEVVAPEPAGPPSPIAPAVAEASNGRELEEALRGESERPVPAAIPALAEPAPVTVEAGLWLLLGVGAALLRFGALGRWPLGETEARLALAAWQSGGEAETLARGLSPLLLNAVDLFFWLFAPTDSWARAIAALAGTATVLAVGLLRPVVGRGAALGAALLIALSPALLFFSRQAHAEALSLLFSLLLLAGVARFTAGRHPRDAWLATIALGLGLASGPGFWSVLVAAALFLGWLRYRSRQPALKRPKLETADDPPAATPQSALSGPANEARALLLDVRPLAPRLALGGLAVFVAAATALGTNPAGLAAAFDLPAGWLSALLGGGPATGLPFMLVLLLYELPIVILAIVGAAVWVEERPGWVGFLLIWSAVTVVPATLFNSGWAGGVAMATLPLALLGGAALARIGEAARQSWRWEVEGAYLGLVAVLGAFSWLNLLAYLQTAEGLHLWLAVASLVVLASGLVMVWGLGGAGGVARVLGVTAALLLPLVAFRTAWMLAFMHGNDPREPLVAAQGPSDPDLRTLAGFLADLSNERLRERDALPIAIQESLGVAPRWYLRDFRQLQLVAGGTPELGETAAALLSPDQPAPAGTIGSRYALRPVWEWLDMGGQPLLRWIVLREVRTGLGSQDAILYVQVPGSQ